MNQESKIIISILIAFFIVFSGGAKWLVSEIGGIVTGFIFFALTVVGIIWIFSKKEEEKE